MISRLMDLNLLVQLDALLAERSVTGAARRLGQSQPTLSGALAKLRRHFDDQLLVRSGGERQLTPLGAQLRPLTEAALESAERVLTSTARFDPAVSTREFTVVTSDYGGAAVLPSLLRVVGERSGGVRVRQIPIGGSGLEEGLHVLRSVDVLLLPRGMVRGLPHLDLFHDEWVCVVSAGNRHVGEEFTLQHAQRLPCVLMTRNWACSLRRAPPCPAPRSRRRRWASASPSPDAFTQMRLARHLDIARTNQPILETAGLMGLGKVSVTTREALHLATMGGAEALDMADRIGSLEPGKAADLILLRNDSPRQRPIVDPFATVVEHSGVGDIDRVLIAGETVKENGRLVGERGERAVRLVEAAWERLSDRMAERGGPSPAMPDGILQAAAASMAPNLPEWFSA
ncbi:LysR family transcriptional regulator [Streptomyces sp. 5-6(2022)]|uniref:LysR family transcriptional regulator n=1 Tax=Streptomyces sp. 5-6(2022) TaxID=2936510 RepID=UPI0023B9BDA9|nr:LysR family transcriptional regulator [Streptomyces sp. 5-6(2022)]